MPHRHDRMIIWVTKPSKRAHRLETKSFPLHINIHKLTRPSPLRQDPQKFASPREAASPQSTSQQRASQPQTTSQPTSSQPAINQQPTTKSVIHTRCRSCHSSRVCKPGHATKSRLLFWTFSWFKLQISGRFEHL